MLNIAPGTIVDSRYEIVELIGEGGNGVVFKTKEIGTERLVALKVLQLRLVSDKESLDRFKREGSVLSQLDHPNILRCFRFGVWNERFPYIAMEYVNGIQLNDAEAVLPQQVVHIGKQICRAMEYAHKANIVHRDLKPANIMIIPDENDLVKVVDFGLA